MSLDPKENATKAADTRRESKGTSEEDSPLDPAFPYRVIAFDPTVFGSVAESSVALE